MRLYPKSKAILERNRQFLTGGVASTNRLTDPEITFVKAEGSYLWDADGNRFIDFHAAFAPFILGHNHPAVNEAVIRSLEEKASLYGAGTSISEGHLGELICQAVPFADRVAILNTGSEATYQAMRLARAATGRDHFIVMQGGYNGWHNDVSCNLMTPLNEVGPRRSPGEYSVPVAQRGRPASTSAVDPPYQLQ